MSSDADLVRKKLVVVGNGNVGKTSLLYAFKDNRFCQDYVPTLFEGNTHVIDIENKRIELLLIDTAGQEEYARCVHRTSRARRRASPPQSSSCVFYE